MTFVFAVTFREFECYIHPVCGLHSGRLWLTFDPFERFIWFEK